MGKSWRRSNGDKKYYDDFEVYSKNEIEYRNHKKEKRVNSALKTKNLDALFDEEEYDDREDE